MFFQLFSTIKVNLVAKIMQSAYLCVIFHVKHKNSPFLAVLTWFLILGKIQDGGQDGDHCWWRHRPPAAPPPIKYTSSCREDQRLSTEGKIVSKYYNRGDWLSLLYHGGVGSCMYVRQDWRPRVKQVFFYNWAIVSRVKFYCSSKNSQMLRVSEPEQ